MMENLEKLVQLEELAREGNVKAQIFLGSSYFYGKGVEKDDEQAVHWFRLTAEQGIAEAQTFLGMMYASGQGIERDYEQEFFWCGLAADQGEACAFRRKAAIDSDPKRPPIPI